MADDNGEITTKHCRSCKQDVPSANFEMHTIHCQRFLTSCPQCGESVNKNLLEEHIEENHVQVMCNVCGNKVEKMELDNHKTSSCPKRPVDCKYCEIKLPACDFQEHEESCGSRTEQCEHCMRRILVKEMEDHIASGCQTPVKTSTKMGQDPGKTRMPERLIGDPSDIRTAPRFLGFPLHPNFQATYSTFNGEIRNPYFPDFDHVSNYSTNVSSVVQNADTQRKASAKHWLTAEKETEENSDTPNVSTTFPKSALERKPAQKNLLPADSRMREGSFPHSVPNPKNSLITEDRSQGNGMLDSDIKPPWNEDWTSSRSAETRIANGFSHGGRYGISEFNSGLNMDVEESVPPDLTDETLLPCEFCNEMFPADSLGFHQVNCDSLPPTPRPPSPPKIKRLSLGTVPDIGAGSAPCEFCLASFPLVDLASHQIFCRQNPSNVHNSEISDEHDHVVTERPQGFESDEVPQPFGLLKSRTPQIKPNNAESTRPSVRALERQRPSHAPQERQIRKKKSRLGVHPPEEEAKSHTQGGRPNHSESSRMNVRSSNEETKSKTTLTSRDTQAREKRKFAARFPENDTSEERPPTHPNCATFAQTKNVTPTSRVEKKSQQAKPKRKPIPKKAPTFSPIFHEVNVLGGEKPQNQRFSGDLNGILFRSGSSVSPQIKHGGPTNQAPATKYGTDKRPTRGNYHTGGNSYSRGKNSMDDLSLARKENPSQDDHTRGINDPRTQHHSRGGIYSRGGNYTRGRNSTRGRSYGSNTITIPHRRSNNSRLVSGVWTAERDVNSQPDLTLPDEAPSFESARGPGRRLGSGDSNSGRLYPSRRNNWD